jgi:hypothetical protein
MSGGWSDQQLDVLGLAVAVSRSRHGKPVGREPRPHPLYKVIPVAIGVDPDITNAVVAHVLGGVGLRRNAKGETTPAAKLGRSSISQAIGALVGQGLLAFRPMVSNDDRQTSGRRDMC